MPKTGEIIYSTCDYCKKEFMYIFKRRHKKYCSVTCNSRQNNGVTLKDVKRGDIVNTICKHCKKEFTYTYYSKFKIFCSKNCGAYYCHKRAKRGKHVSVLINRSDLKLAETIASKKGLDLDDMLSNILISYFAKVKKKMLEVKRNEQRF